MLQQSLLDRRCLGGTEDFVKSMGDKGAGPGRRRNILDSEPQVASRGKIIEGLTEIRNLLLNAWFRRLGGSDHFRMKVEVVGDGPICALPVEYHMQRFGYIRSRSYMLYLYMFDTGPNKHDILLRLSLPRKSHHGRSRAGAAAPESYPQALGFLLRVPFDARIHLQGCRED